MNQYAKRKPIDLDKAGGYYCRHVSAMTTEGLHSKSDIAAELGWRDMQIDRLQRALEKVMRVRRDSYDASASGRPLPGPDEAIESNALHFSRVEVIDHTADGTGRDYTKLTALPFRVALSVQDQGRTLKVFLSEEAADVEDYPDMFMEDDE